MINKSSAGSFYAYCEACPLECSTCQSYKICTNCDEGFFLYNGS
jgi:hypothetical protein